LAGRRITGIRWLVANVAVSALRRADGSICTNSAPRSCSQCLSEDVGLSETTGPYISANKRTPLAAGAIQSAPSQNRLLERWIVPVLPTLAFN
jgi:hypothetical protein